MTRPPDARNAHAPAMRGASGADLGRGQHAQYTGAPLEVFRAAHGGKFTRSGNGLRTNCPNCDDRKAALSVTERDGRLLVHCFRTGCAAVDIIAAVGLRFADVMPPRSWPESPEERRQARRAIREAGWSAALSVLALEAKVALIAARQLARWQVLDEADDARLAAAVDRIDNAAAVLTEAARWRPAEVLR